MDNQRLPSILMGPILRRVTQDCVVWSLVTSGPDAIRLMGFWGGDVQWDVTFTHDHSHCIRIGTHAWLHTLVLHFPNTDEASHPLDGAYQQMSLQGIAKSFDTHLMPQSLVPEDTWIDYDIGIRPLNEQDWQWLHQTQPDMLYGDHIRPRFCLRMKVDQLLHGSCRKPHYKQSDGLIQVDSLLSQIEEAEQSPAVLLMSGDQVYVDDVAGSMLVAIHQVIAQIGLYDEVIIGSSVDDSQALYQSPLTYYQRAKLLPDTKANAVLRERFFRGASKPIFTSANADNHLMSLAEINAMYLLVWSPALWSNVCLDLHEVEQLPDALAPILEQYHSQYHTQCDIIKEFASTLPQVRRALAHIPVYMIFDDHDVTDDWNLTRGWEETAYSNPFSKRIIGNALIGYWLFQGWANDPASFSDSFVASVKQCFPTEEKENSAHYQPLKSSKTNQTMDLQQQDSVIQYLLDFEGWHYSLPTSPKIVVLDTRTRRWRSERDLAQPSGLMNWESLSELQLELLNEEKVILVSPAPIFGVKLIEVIQHIFTWFGHALTVDAENWMAHPGAANVILNIFRHAKTPRNFVILSGDVHYSFVYDVELKHVQNSPRIWQITSSGVKNAFPEALIITFDKLNRWLFASYSPLNWFTRRRAMRIRQRRPSHHKERYRHQRLVNSSGIGRVWLDDEGAPSAVEVLKVNGEVVSFTKGHDFDLH